MNILTKESALSVWKKHVPETVSSEQRSERRRLTQTLHYVYMPKNTKRRVSKQEYEHAHDFRYAEWVILLAPTLNYLGELYVQISYNDLRKKKCVFF